MRKKKRVITTIAEQSNKNKIIFFNGFCSFNNKMNKHVTQFWPVKVIWLRGLLGDILVPGKSHRKEMLPFLPLDCQVWLRCLQCSAILLKPGGEKPHSRGQSPRTRSIPV